MTRMTRLRDRFAAAVGLEAGEVLFLLSLELAWGWWLVAGTVPLPAVGMVLASLAVHLVLDGRRWQMLPASVVALVMAAPAILSLALGGPGEPAGLALGAFGLAGEPGSNSRWAAVLLGCVQLLSQLAIIASGLGAFLMPVPRLLPLPKDAPFKVGTLHLHLEDSSRPEWSGRHEHGRRQIMAQVFYPSRGEPVAPGARPFPSTYFRQLDRFGPGLAYQGRLPGWIVTHLAHIRVNALRHTACAEPSSAGGWPLVVFSHGFSGYGTQNYQMMEQMACRGYVVVALDHVYDSCMTVLSNGEIRRFEARMALTLPTEELYRARSSQLVTRAEDVLFLLGSLDRINRGEGPATSELCSSPNTHWRTLVGKLDTTGVGLIGHSFGGATAILASRMASQDPAAPRVRAILGLDAWMFPLPPEIREGGLADQQPDFHLCLLEAPKFFEEDHDISRDNRKQAQRILRETARQGSRASHVLVDGSRHHAFCDLPQLMSPTLFRWLGLNFGTLPYAEMQRVMLNCAVGVFERSQIARDPTSLAQAVKGLPSCSLTEF